MKKKILSVLLCFALAFILTACGSSENESESAQAETTANETESESELTVDEELQAYMDRGHNLNRGDLIAHLELYYPEDEVEEAVENANIDWQELALENANELISGPVEYSEDEVRDQLEYNEFTDEEIDYALEKADWDKQTEG